MRCDEFGVKNPHEGDCGTNREMEEMRKIISRLVLENLYTKIELKKMNERIEKLESEDNESIIIDVYDDYMDVTIPDGIPEENVERILLDLLHKEL